MAAALLQAFDRPAVVPKENRMADFDDDFFAHAEICDALRKTMARRREELIDGLLETIKDSNQLVVEGRCTAENALGLINRQLENVESFNRAASKMKLPSVLTYPLTQNQPPDNSP